MRMDQHRLVRPSRPAAICQWSCLRGHPGKSRACSWPCQAQHACCATWHCRSAQPTGLATPRQTDRGQVYHNREATCKIAWAWLQRCKGTEPEHPDAQLSFPHLERRLGRARRDRSAAGFYRRHSREPSPASLPPPQHLHAAAASSSLLHPAAAASAAGLSDAAGPADPLASRLLHMSLGGEAGPSEPLVGTSPPSGLPVGSLGLPGALPMILDVDGFPSASPTYPPGAAAPLSCHAAAAAATEVQLLITPAPAPLPACNAPD